MSDVRSDALVFFGASGDLAFKSIFPALQGLAMLQLAAGNRAGAQAQHEILLRACGATCPETAEVEKALKAGATP